jgi:hypothetical protein
VDALNEQESDEEHEASTRKVKEDCFTFNAEKIGCHGRTVLPRDPFLFTGFVEPCGFTSWDIPSSLATNPLFSCLHQAISVGFSLRLVGTANNCWGQQFVDDRVCAMTTFVVGTQLQVNEEGQLYV